MHIFSYLLWPKLNITGGKLWESIQAEAFKQAKQTNFYSIKTFKPYIMFSTKKN